MINIFTFKWGDKYSCDYVNRLYGSLVKHIDAPFKFHCITDDKKGIRPEVYIIDYNSFDRFNYPKDRVFTREKLCLFNLSHEEHNVWIDLDVLIHDNITELVTTKSTKPKLIFNYWFDLQKRTMFNYGRGASCHINSSFVYWSSDSGQWLYDYTQENSEKIFFTYNSLDKYLFYQHYWKDRLDTWDEGIAYNYNYDNALNEKKVGHKIALFNTSHIRLNRTAKDALELHETKGWAKELWESYDA